MTIAIVSCYNLPKPTILRLLVSVVSWVSTTYAPLQKTTMTDKEDDYETPRHKVGRQVILSSEDDDDETMVEQQSKEMSSFMKRAEKSKRLSHTSTSPTSPLLNPNPIDLCSPIPSDLTTQQLLKELPKLPMFETNRATSAPMLPCLNDERDPNLVFPTQLMFAGPRPRTPLLAATEVGIQDADIKLPEYVTEWRLGYETITNYTVISDADSRTFSVQYLAVGRNW